MYGSNLFFTGCGHLIVRRAPSNALGDSVSLPASLEMGGEKIHFKVVSPVSGVICAVIGVATRVHNGELAEWSKAAVLKTVDGKPSGGSNPSLSATHKLRGSKHGALFHSSYSNL